MLDRSYKGYLRRLIKRTYKWYTGERTDGTATILDLAKIFKLPIDEGKLEDYTVRTIDFDRLEIEIVSKSTGYSYYAIYSSSSDLLNYGGGEIPFINHSIYYGEKAKRETTLASYCDEVFYDRFTLRYDERYSLVLNKCYPNHYGLFSLKSVDTSIWLCDNRSSRTLGIEYSIRKPQEENFEFEMERRGWDNEYQYKLISGLIYFLEKHSDGIHAVVFAEQVFEGLKNYISYNYDVVVEEEINSENETLTDDNVYSVINLYGPSRKRIFIFKERNNFKIKCYNKASLEDEYLIPVLKPESVIDYTECEYLANELAKYVKDENEAKDIRERLDEIKFRLMVSKGLAKKEETALDIEKYRDLPFDDAIKLFVENKDEIFKEIMKRLETKEY